MTPTGEAAPYHINRVEFTMRKSLLNSTRRYLRPFLAALTPDSAYFNPKPIKSHPFLLFKTRKGDFQWNLLRYSGTYFRI